MSCGFWDPQYEFIKEDYTSNMRDYIEHVVNLMETCSENLYRRFYLYNKAQSSHMQ
jgi:hypothetical protein